MSMPQKFVGAALKTAVASIHIGHVGGDCNHGIFGKKKALGRAAKAS